MNTNTTTSTAARSARAVKSALEKRASGLPMSGREATALRSHERKIGNPALNAEDIALACGLGVDQIPAHLKFCAGYARTALALKTAENLLKLHPAPGVASGGECLRAKIERTLSQARFDHANNAHTSAACDERDAKKALLQSIYAAESARLKN